MLEAFRVGLRAVGCQVDGPPPSTPLADRGGVWHLSYEAGVCVGYRIQGDTATFIDAPVWDHDRVDPIEVRMRHRWRAAA